MTKRCKILILLAGLGLMVGAYTVLIRESEPTYKGRKLSDWVRHLSFTSSWTAPDPEAEKAISQIGSKASPGC
jgi:hypothetical protein